MEDLQTRCEYSESHGFGPVVLDHLTRRDLLVGAGGLFLLGASGCRSENESPSSVETREITHAAGRSRVPREPRRVVTLDPFFTLQAAVEIGVPVVGTAVLSMDDPYPSTLTGEETADIEKVGVTGEPNIETIASLEPDLILATTFVELPIEQLEEIAPVVVFGDPLDWKPYVRALGEATGRPDEVERRLSEYEARVEEMKPRLRDVTVSSISLPGNEMFEIYVEGPGAFGPSRVMQEVGVARPENETSDDSATFSKSLSLEALPSIRGEALFYGVGVPGVPDSAEAASDTVGSPLWREIDAVENGDAYEVDQGHWLIFGGFRSANLVLDDIEAHLTRKG